MPSEDQMPGPAAPGLQFVFWAKVAVLPPLELGVYDNHRRRIVPIAEGVVEGPGFEGVVLAGGADWQSLRLGDGASQLEARYVLQHRDGTLVSVVNRGVRRGPPEVMARLAAGEVVDPSLYYFRACPQFDVRPGPHGWLAENAFVCVGKRWPDGVELEFYRVL